MGHRRRGRDSGRDSAGVAVYRDPLPAGECKLSLLDPAGAATDWSAIAASLDARLLADHGDQAVLAYAGEAEDAREQLAARHRALLTMSAGAAIETAKRVGDPERLIEGIGLRGLAGSHALGHTRMATESMITTEHSHPFSTGADLCLVHNGSLSNHNCLGGSAGSPTSPTATETRCSSTPGASSRRAPRAEPEPASPPSLS